MTAELRLHPPAIGFALKGCVLQVVKVAVPVYYGSRYQCEKVPQHQVIKALQSKKVHISLTAEAKAAVTKHPSGTTC